MVPTEEVVPQAVPPVKYQILTTKDREVTCKLNDRDYEKYVGQTSS